MEVNDHGCLDVLEVHCVPEQLGQGGHDGPRVAARADPEEGGEVRVHVEREAVAKCLRSAVRKAFVSPTFDGLTVFV